MLRHHKLLFWLVLLLPWMLDFWGGKAVLASVFGALIWGLALVVAWAWTESFDARLKTRLLMALGVLVASWITYWALVFSGPQPTYLDDRGLKLLSWLHAGLLLAGAGIIFFLLVISSLGIFRENELKKNSWERRHKKSSLPSLEAVSRLTRGSLRLASKFWAMGLVLAFVVALMRWKRANIASQELALDWLWDPRILFVSFLWLCLVLGDQFAPRQSSRFYLFLSLVFLGIFSWFIAGSHPALREPIHWFAH